jgi:hypothetical protein
MGTGRKIVKAQSQSLPRYGCNIRSLTAELSRKALESQSFLYETRVVILKRLHFDHRVYELPLFL